MTQPHVTPHGNDDDDATSSEGGLSRFIFFGAAIVASLFLLWGLWSLIPADNNHQAGAPAPARVATAAAPVHEVATDKPAETACKDYAYEPRFCHVLTEATISDDEPAGTNHLCLWPAPSSEVYDHVDLITDHGTFTTGPQKPLDPQHPVTNIVGVHVVLNTPSTVKYKIRRKDETCGKEPA